MLLLSSSASAQTQLYWGDTHVHTAYSSDAFLNGNFSIGPDEAFRFAKGEVLHHPYNNREVKLARPLDFLVVSDHAEALGVVDSMYFQSNFDEVGFWLSLRRKLSGWLVKTLLNSGNGAATFRNIQAPIAGNVVGDPVANPENRLPKGMTLFGDVSGIEKNIWHKIIAAAERHNEPGAFTAFIGWEWSSTPMGANLHRVVFTPDGADKASQYMPFSSLDSQYPEDLWRWLESTAETTDSQFIAIPHNSNVSKGYMFAKSTLKGEAMTQEYAQLRSKFESVVEITQMKGDSETWPDLSPEDAFADFEGYPHYLQPNQDGDYRATRADFVRQAIASGMELEQSLGINPFKLGVIGSTDTHTGFSTPDDDNFLGKMAFDSVPENKASRAGLPSNGWGVSASGIAAVWAEENTREAIFKAFKQREVYASTGPRISLRVFGGFDLDEAMLNSTQFVSEAYKRGVPMGGELMADTKKRPLKIAIKALRDAEGANLDQVHIVKLWLDSEGKPQEKVYPALWSGQRPLASNGFPEPVKNTVNLLTGELENSVGATELSGVWHDPDFNPDQYAAYYVRVIQIPTARHSLYDTIALGVSPETSGQPATIQERAYSSAIWYTPAASSE
ncbi:DUF3604 domain-containing protein [Spongiibacter pelagi]|uniref:DUF3604 domain-containing protein n=1 Tax=Spongiibacter pelagi TaxID=2760804 RepID=UPI001CC22E31|nr:DUF3604 domain-containing protein [Spongiibacter pelagi]